jgi:hypothetical protein
LAWRTASWCAALECAVDEMNDCHDSEDGCPGAVPTAAVQSEGALMGGADYTASWQEWCELLVGTKSPHAAALRSNAAADTHVAASTVVAATAGAARAPLVRTCRRVLVANAGENGSDCPEGPVGVLSDARRRAQPSRDDDGAGRWLFMVQWAAEVAYPRAGWLLAATLGVGAAALNAPVGDRAGSLYTWADADLISPAASGPPPPTDGRSLAWAADEALLLVAWAVVRFRLARFAAAANEPRGVFQDRTIAVTGATAATTGAEDVDERNDKVDNAEQGAGSGSASLTDMRRRLERQLAALTAALTERATLAAATTHPCADLRLAARADSQAATERGAKRQLQPVGVTFEAAARSLEGRALRRAEVARWEGAATAIAGLAAARLESYEMPSLGGLEECGAEPSRPLRTLVADAAAAAAALDSRWRSASRTGGAEGVDTTRRTAALARAADLGRLSFPAAAVAAAAAHRSSISADVRTELASRREALDACLALIDREEVACSLAALRRDEPRHLHRAAAYQALERAAAVSGLSTGGRFTATEAATVVQQQQQQKLQQGGGDLSTTPAVAVGWRRRLLKGGGTQDRTSTATQRDPAATDVARTNDTQRLADEGAELLRRFAMP